MTKTTRVFGGRDTDVFHQLQVRAGEDVVHQKVRDTWDDHWLENQAKDDVSNLEQVTHCPSWSPGILINPHVGSGVRSLLAASGQVGKFFNTRLGESRGSRLVSEEVLTFAP